MNRWHVAILIFLLPLISSKYSSAQQNWLWSSGGNGNDEALANAVDSNGNIYTTGYFSLSAKFDSTVLTSAGSGDIFISKQNSVGQYQWTVRAGGSQSDRAYGISTDPFGNIFITGFYSDTAAFGSDTLKSDSGSLDIFVAKLDSAGNFLWAKSFGGSDIDIGLAIHADFMGNALVTGQFRATAHFGGFTFNSIKDTSGNPSFDIFIMKLDTAGNVIWAKQGGGKYDDRGLAVSSDSAGNVYFTGQYSDTLILENVYPNLGRSIGFVAKLDSSGKVIWMHPLLATLVLAYNVQCYNNDVYISGDFRGQLGITAKTTYYLNSAYVYKIFVARLDSSGAVLWASTDGSNNPVSALAMTIDTAGGAYIAGTFNCTMTEYDSIFGSGIFNSVGFRDVYITKFSNSGKRLYERQFGGPGDDFCSAISIFVKDYPIIAGSFETIFNVPRGNNFILNPTDVDSSRWGPSQSAPFCNDSNYHRYISLYSDGNKDIFSTSPMDTTRSPYDYFDRNGGACLRDSLLPSINMGADTVIGCDTVILYATTHTGSNGVIGPEYDYMWSNGGTDTLTKVTITGWYYLNLTNKDNCRHYLDSIYAIVYPSPPDPIIGTTAGTIRSAISDSMCDKNLQTLIVVFPDTATLYPTNINPRYKIVWNTPYGAVIGDSAKTLVSGIYTITVSTPQGLCGKTACIYVIVYGQGHVLPSNFVPQIHFTDTTFDRTDTVSVCYHDFFGVSLVDSADWAKGDTIDYLYTYVDWTITGGFEFFPILSYPTTFVLHYQRFRADFTGPCTITCDVEDPIHGGTLLTVTRNFYLIVFPAPPLNGQWHGPSFFCPGDTALLTVTEGTYYNTSGPGIAYISANQDSIKVTQPGTFRCIYTVVDSVTGCSSTDSIFFTLYTIPAPKLTLVPSNGLICPNDSVMLIAEQGTNYVWAGPLENVIGHTDTIYASSPGYYHYSFTDTSGCNLVSEFKELKTYSTPYLSGSPSSTICSGTSATLTVVSNDSSSIQWLPPLSGSSLTQIVDSAGTYSCSITSCGITTTASFTIKVDLPNVHIAVSGDSIICIGDTSILNGNTGMAAYDWEPGEYSSQSFYATTAGTYTLTVTDFMGCTASASVTIDTLPTPPLPVASGAIICAGDSVTLTASGNGRTDWYGSYYGSIIDTMNIYITPRLYADTTFYVTAYNSICHSAKVAVPVSMNPASLLPPIFGDTLICSYDSLFLSTNPLDSGTYNWSGPDGFNSTLQTIYIYPVDSTRSGYYLLQVSDTMCMSPRDSIYIKALPRGVLGIVSSLNVICSGQNDTLRAVQSVSHYLWQPGGSSDSLFIADSSGTYSLIATDKNGCIDTSRSVSLTVVPLPIAPQINDTSTCIGTSMTLTHFSPYTVHWYSNSDSLLFTGNVFITPVLNDSARYYVLQVDTNECRSVFDTVLVQLNPIPPAPILTGDTAYCVGSTIALNASTPDSTYYWKGPNGFNSVNRNISLSNCIINESGVYSFFVSSKGCIDSSTINIAVYSIPANNIYNNGPVCVGNALIFSTDSIPGGLYQWHGPSGFTSTHPADTILHASLLQSGYYTLVISSPECSSNVDSVYLKVAPYPLFNLGNDTVICPGKPITLKVDSGYDSYLWSNGSNSNSITVTDSGDYSVKVTNLPDCSSSDSIKIGNIDCEPFIPNVITPNNDGRNDYFYVTYKGAHVTSIIIYNRWGKIVRQLSGEDVRWDGRSDDGKEVSDGTYYYVVEATDYFDKPESFHGYIDVLR